MARPTWTEQLWILACLAIGAVVLWALRDWLRAPYTNEDSYQYLDAARNIASGNCLCTWVAHFDEQVAAERWPVPFTHFPPGYSLLIAALSRTGLSFEAAGYALSVAGFLATIWLIWDMGLTLGAPRWMVAGAALLWIANADVLTQASMIATEALFTAVFTAVIVLVLRDARSGGQYPALLVGIGLLTGVAYWIRYAGVFIAPPAALYLAWRAWRDRRAWPWSVAGLAVAAALIGAVQVRNIQYTGSWKGGFTTGATHSVEAALIGTVKGFYHVAFGDRVMARVDIWLVVFLASALVTLALVVVGLRQARWTIGGGSRGRALAWIGVFSLAYTAGVTLTAMFTIADQFSRYLAPTYPILLVSGVTLLSLGPSRKQLVACVPMIVSVVIIQSRSLATRPIVPPHVIARDALDEEVQPGVSVKQWLRDRMTSNDVILSVNGQGMYHVLQRPVVSLIYPQHTSRRSDEAAFRSLMLAERARYLVVFPGPEDRYRAEQYSIAFLRNLTAGDVPPWLAVAARTPSIAVFECDSCVE